MTSSIMPSTESQNQTEPTEKKVTVESNGGQAGLHPGRDHSSTSASFSEHAGMGDGSGGADVLPETEKGEEEIWGTLQELLLACAVRRHGTSSWDLLAMEVRTRSPLAAQPGLTAHSCRLRFRHLHRRFSTAGSGGGEEVDEGDGDDPDASAAEGWVDELRRLRVAELRRDLERCDLSIGCGILRKRESPNSESHRACFPSRLMAITRPRICPTKPSFFLIRFAARWSRK
jgi:hypothetical protein